MKKEKIHKELAEIQKELREIRGILEQKPILEKTCIYDAVIRGRSKNDQSKEENTW